MKTVQSTFTKRTIIRQVSALLLVALSFSVLADNSNFDTSLLSPLKKVEHKRGPANFTPTDETGYIPMVQEIELEASERLKDDRGGTLKTMKARLDYWREREEYADAWDLGSTGLYETPTDSQKRSYLESNFLRYFDRRLSGEIKNAKKGSALSSVRTVEQALRPDTKVQVSKNVKIRFSARVLQRYGTVRVINPYVKTEAKVTLDGKVDVKMYKEFEEVGFKAEANYSYNSGRYIASLNQRISDRWSANVSSEQSDRELPFNHDINTYRINYGFGF